MKHTILTIDDNAENNKLITYYLHKEFEVLQASCGEDGLAMIRKYPVDVVLLDIMMPGMNGYEVLSEIIADPKTCETPVIMVSAKTEMEDVKHALQNGALDYIKKPIDFSELHNKISIALKIKRQIEEINRFSSISHLHDSLIHARRLQQSLLPDKLRFKTILPDSFIIDVPKDIVSGDFYWLNFVEDRFCVSIFDSTGHGVPGAMLSIIGHILLNEIVLHNKEKSPTNIFNFLAYEINQNLNRSTDTYAMNDGMDGVFCSINEHTDVLEYASANRPVVVCRRNHEPLFIDGFQAEPFVSNEIYSLYIVKGDLFSIGRESFDVQFTNHMITLKANDTVYLFTDGITDQIGGNDNKKLTKRKFFDIILQIQNLPMQEQKIELYNYIEEWKSQTVQTDDILVIGLKYKSS